MDESPSDHHRRVPDDLVKELDMRLICDTQEAEIYQKFDMAEVQARESTVCIPPWYGTTKPREEEEEDEEAELDLRWICDHHDEETTEPTMHGQRRNMEGTLVSQEKGPRTGTTDHKTISV